MKLPYKPNLAIAELGRGLVGKRTQPQVAAVYVTPGGSIKRAQDVQQGTLTGAGLTHNRQHLSLAHAETQIFKEHQIGRARSKNLLEVLHPEQIGHLSLMQPASPASHF